MPITIDLLGNAKPEPGMSILKLVSRSHGALDPDTLFEWHQAAEKVFVVRRRKKMSGIISEGILLSSNVKTADEAKMCVASYVQGFAHGRDEEGVGKV